MSMIPKRTSIVALSILAAVLLILCGTGSAEAQSERDRVLVLPFSINAAPELGYLHESLPSLLADQLKEKGIISVPEEKMRAVIAQHNIEYLDLQTARDLALLVNAGHSVYGSFSQVGETISLDVRLVDSFGLEPDKPFFVVRKGLINILPAVEELANRIALELSKKDQVAEIEVLGNQVLDKEVVLLRLKSEKGEPFDPALLDEDLRNIYKLGYFKDVSIDVEDTPQGKKIIYHVVEKPRIQAITITGADAIDEDDILEIIGTREGSILNEQMLADDLNTVRALYRKEGYYLAKVDHTVADGGNGQARLTVNIDEGEKLYIRKITIKGAEQLDEDDLKDQLELSERGFFSWITSSGILDEQLLDRDAAALEAYYTNRGFIDAKVGQPEVKFETEGIEIIFSVHEGDRYKVGTVDLKGDLLEPKEELFKKTDTDELSQDDDYFDRSVLRKDIKKLTDFYMEYGYAFAEVDVMVDPNPETLKVNVTFVLKKGNLVFIRRVITEGNTKTRNNVVLREMRLVDGDLYSGKKLARSSQRLSKLDFFESVDIESLPTDNPGEIDLKVKVKEKPTGSIGGGVGYSSFDDFFFGATIAENNIFGTGNKVDLSAQIGGSSTQFKLTFLNPRLYDTKLSMAVDGFWWRTDYDDYMRETRGGKLTLGYPLGEYTMFYGGYTFDYYTIYDVESDAAELIRDYEGDNIASTMDFKVIRDTTDNRFLPTTGTVNTLTGEYGGGLLGGTDNYMKIGYESHYFTKVYADTIFHIKGRIGHAFKNFSDDEIPPWERYYLGGINSVRGYKGRYISPRDPISDDRIGGNKEFVTQFEYFFPVWSDYNIIGLGFFDMGNAWDDDESFFEDTKQANGDSLPLGLYKSVGMGIRWNSPLGPLRLEYGWPLDELRENNKSGRFEFSMGTAF